LWQPDSQVGLIVLQPRTVQQIKHEVEILGPSEFEVKEAEDSKS